MDGMDEIVGEFLVESYENLDQLDRDLVALEQSPDARDLLGSVFRTIHTIKGTSGFLAFGKLEAVAHVGENLLAKLRDGVMTMTPAVTDVLLEMVDSIRALLGQIEADGTEGDVDVAGAVEHIKVVLAGGAAPAPAPAPVVEPEPVVAPVLTTPEPVMEPVAEPVVEPVAAEADAHVTADVDEHVTDGEHADHGADHDDDPAGHDEVAHDAAHDAAGHDDVAHDAAHDAADVHDAAHDTAHDAPAQPVAAAPAPVAAPAPAAPAAAAPAAPAAKPAPKAAESHPEGGARRTAADSSIRVDVDVLDDLMRLTGELVLTRNQIMQRVTSEGADVDLLRASQRLNLIAGELQEGVMKTRMQPIDALWSKLPRVVRDLGSQLGRQVTLEMVGRETELDRTLLEAVKDPLTHLVRNAVDHGIEAADTRVAAGKPAGGTLTLRARHESGQVVVEVADDGAGIDPTKIGAKAVEKGLVTLEALSRMNDADILQMIFAPGFSTAAAVTNVSGRGVGMDVVKTNIEAIGGTIEVESVAGRGTTCRLRIPLTLAIVPALTIECAGERYAVPQISLLELVALDAEKAAAAVEDVGGAPVYRLRGDLLPLVTLADVMQTPSDREDGHLVIAVLRSEGRRFGLIVDRVINTEEIVVKALGNQLKSIGLYSGATILGDGAVALILDVQALARRALRPEAADGATNERVAAIVAGISNEERMLVAAIGGGRRVAIPLTMVTRLEQIKVASVESVGHREVVQYRGAILPIIRLGQHLGAYGDSERETLEVVVYTDHDRSVAIVVEEILDIVDGAAAVHSDIDDLGLVGSAVIGDRVTELLDVRAAILAADPAFFTSPGSGMLAELGSPTGLMEV